MMFFKDADELLVNAWSRIAIYMYTPFNNAPALRRAYILPTDMNDQLDCSYSHAVSFNKHVMLLVNDYGYKHLRGRRLPDGHSRPAGVSISNYRQVYGIEHFMKAPSQVYQLGRNAYFGTLILHNR